MLWGESYNTLTVLCMYRKNGLDVEIGIGEGGKVDKILVQHLLVPGENTQ